MAKVFIQESTLTAIGDAIRNKTGKTALINPTNMPTEIASISGGGGSSEPVYGAWQNIEEPANSDGTWVNTTARIDNIYLIGNVAGVKHIKFKYNHMMNGTVESIAFEIPDSNPNGVNATFYIGILDLGMAYLHLYLDGDSFNLYAKDPEKSGALQTIGGGLICYLKYATAS